MPQKAAQRRLTMVVPHPPVTIAITAKMLYSSVFLETLFPARTTGAEERYP
jgi:hypothetical protein